MKTTDVILGFNKNGELEYIQGFDIETQRDEMLKKFDEVKDKFKSNYMADISRLKDILNN